MALGFNGCGISANNIPINQSIIQLDNKTLEYVSRKSDLQVLTPFTTIMAGFFKEGSFFKEEIANFYNDSNGDFSVSNYLSVNLVNSLSRKYNLVLNKHDNKNI